MKKIIKSSLLLLGALVMFTACSDDRDSNPTLVQPDSFVLNAPAYATSDIDLASSTAIPFTWSQPDYGGFPVATEYQFQISTTGNFTTSVEEAIADETGETVADYATLEDVFTECKGGVTAAHIAKAMQQLEKWPQDEVPATQEVYLRAVAKAIGAQPVYSNVIKLDKVIPYYVELKDAPIVLWYLVGNCIGEGDWSNSADKIGVSLIPLLPDPNAEFNKVDGTGIVVYAGYFPAGGQFKMIKTPGSWDEQMNFTNVKGSDGIVSDEDGDNHNIGILNEGYYKIIVNTEKNEIEVTAIEAAPEYGTITMPGKYQGWDASANAMTPMAGARVNEWMATITFDADANPSLSDEGMKFANGSWDVNWGNDNHSFPLGLGVQGQGNIHYKKGTYTVYFNDILGIYYFIEQ
jgi:hypothetical protein